MLAYCFSPYQRGRLGNDHGGSSSHHSSPGNTESLSQGQAVTFKGQLQVANF